MYVVWTSPDGYSIDPRSFSKFRDWNEVPGERGAIVTIGGSIFLIAVGAILYFATNLHVAHVSIDTVGLILMLAGLAGLVLGFVQQGMTSRRVRRQVTVEDRRDPNEPRY